MAKREFRFISKEVRAAEGEKPAIEGYAAVFDKATELYSGPGFTIREVIRPGAFKRSIASGDDVRCLFNHDSDNVLGRNKSGTLELREDKKGLFYRCDMPSTTMGRDVYEMIRRGDVDQCSFGFMVRTQNRTEETDKDGNITITRELLDVDLMDVSPVTFPAYPQTSVEARSKMWPDGLPEEIEKRDDGCNCQCEDCKEGDCANCSNEQCNGENCDHNPGNDTDDERSANDIHARVVLARLQ